MFEEKLDKKFNECKKFISNTVKTEESQKLVNASLNLMKNMNN